MSLAENRIAAARHVRTNRAIIDLLAGAIAACGQRRTMFLELADRLRVKLANMTFGY
jgi:hypothetical protein